MKVVAMHQPHYFPWLGYLDKMVKTDEFVVLDEVQFTDGSPCTGIGFCRSTEMQSCCP